MRLSADSPLSAAAVALDLRREWEVYDDGLANP